MVNFQMDGFFRECDMVRNIFFKHSNVNFRLTIFRTQKLLTLKTNFRKILNRLFKIMMEFRKSLFDKVVNFLSFYFQCLNIENS